MYENPFAGHSSTSRNGNVSECQRIGIITGKKSALQKVAKREVTGICAVREAGITLSTAGPHARGITLDRTRGSFLESRVMSVLQVAARCVMRQQAAAGGICQAWTLGSKVM